MTSKVQNWTNELFPQNFHHMPHCILNRYKLHVSVHCILSYANDTSENNSSVFIIENFISPFGYMNILKFYFCSADLPVSLLFVLLMFDWSPQKHGPVSPVTFKLRPYTNGARGWRVNCHVHSCVLSSPFVFCGACAKIDARELNFQMEQKIHKEIHMVTYTCKLT